MSAVPRRSNGSIHAVPVNDDALALRGDGAMEAELTIDAAAQALRKSISWTRAHAAELGGHKVDGEWRIPSIEIERHRTTTVERVTFGAAAPRERDVGPRAAAIFERFEQGQSTSRIVRELAEPPEFVAKMRRAWLEGYQADRTGVVLRCRACDRPSDPHFGYCGECGPHAERISEEQRRALAGQDIPQAIRCSCGRVADAGTCSTCIDEITVAIEGAALVVRVGERLLKMLPAHPLLAQLAPATEVPRSPAPTIDGPPPTAATQQLVAEAHRLIEQAKAPIPMTEIEE